MIEGKTKLERWKNVLRHPMQLKESMMNITPEQQLRSQLVGFRGNMIGLTVAWVFLWIRGMWFFSISMFFIIFLQLIGYIGIRQKYVQVMKIKKEMETMDIFNKLEGRQ